MIESAFDEMWFRDEMEWTVQRSFYTLSVLLVIHYTTVTSQSGVGYPPSTIVLRAGGSLASAEAHNRIVHLNTSRDASRLSSPIDAE